MQLIKTLFLGILIGLIPIFVFSQGNSDTTTCYVDNIKSDENVFYNITHEAYPKEGYISFRNFLMTNINHNKFIINLSRSQPIFSDTARVKFIISKNGIMSNLEVKDTKNDIFKGELEKVLKQYSCKWLPGTYDGARKSNSWYKCEIFYYIELKNGEVQIILKLKSNDFAGKK